MSTLPIRRHLSIIVVLGALLMPQAIHAAPLDATDTNTLRQSVGKQVEVEGTPTKTGLSKSSTVAYLNFGGAHQGVALVFFLKPGTSGAFGSEDDLKQYVGKKIVVSGKLEEYKGDLQIKVDSTNQIKPAP